MKELIRKIHRRMVELQEKRWFLISASVIAVITILVVGIPVANAAKSLDVQRQALVEALTGQSLRIDGGTASSIPDIHAQTIRDEGSVTLNGTRYENQDLVEFRGQVFDGEGNIISPRTVAELLLLDERPALAPDWLIEQPSMTVTLMILTIAWMLMVIWLRLLIEMILTILATAVPMFGAWAMGSLSGIWLFAGFGVLTFTFVLLCRMLLVLLDRPWQVCAVAHTVVKEVSRTRMALVFIVGLLLILPLLPMWLDPDSPLRFQVQSFISRSFGLTYAIAACFTLVVGCSSIAFEIRDRQIWQLVSKPVSRVQYLLGKWLGIMSINLVLLAVAGVSIFLYIQYLRAQPSGGGMEGRLDAVMLRDQVLTARISTQPTYDELDGEQVYQRVQQVIQRDPELAALEDVPLAREREIAATIIEAYNLQQRTIPPISLAPNVISYEFEGLERLRGTQQSVTLQYRFHILDDSSHSTYKAAFWINENPDSQMTRSYVPVMTHQVIIGTDQIREDGTLSVQVANLYQPPPGSPYGSINFEPEDFQLYYKVADFEGNFIRAVMINWTKLSFLAMLAIFLSVFLSFPVALMTSFTIFLAGATTPFLEVSLQQYVPPAVDTLSLSNTGPIIRWFFMRGVRAVGLAVVAMLSGFAEHNVGTELVEGRLISWGDVFKSGFQLTLVWTGLAFVLAWAAIRRRELATYSGHG